MTKKKFIAIDSNRMKPLIAPDWTTMDGIKPFFQKALYTYPFEGETTKNVKHTHKYEIDKNGNGWATWASNPKEPKIKHRHQIINWEILESQSECYPRCEEKFGIKGVAPHAHLFKGQKVQKYDDRYSITVTTDYTSTGGNKLKERMEEQISKGISKILSYYSKKETPSIIDYGFAEDWDLNPRPEAKLKVLVSLFANTCDNLSDLKPPSTLPTAYKEIFLNTYNLEKRILGVQNLLLSYNKKAMEFYGVTPGLDFLIEANKLSTFYPALVELMQANDFQYPKTQSKIIALGIDDEHKSLYALFNDGDKFKNLYKRFDIFTNYPALRNDRTVNLLVNLNEIYDIYNNSEQIPFMQFANNYILRPPKYDFSKQSITKHLATNPAMQKVEETPGAIKMGLEVFYPDSMKTTHNAVFNPENQKALAEATNTATDWVGDNIMGGGPEGGWWTLGSLSKNMTSVETVFNGLLNKIPIQNLLMAALECLNFRGAGALADAWAKSKEFLNQANSFVGTSLPLFGLPKIFFPSDLPTTDYLRDVLKQLYNAIISAVLNALLTMVLMIIEAILDMCNECGLGDVDERGRPKAFGHLTPEGIMNRMNQGDTGGVTIGLMGAMGLDAATATQGQNQAGKVSADIAYESGINPNKIETFGAEEVSDFIFKLMPGVEKGEDVADASSAGTEDTDDPEKQATGEDSSKTQAEQAKEEVAQFLDASFAATTPEEMGNLLMGCQVGNEVTEVLKAAADRYPTVRRAFADNQGEIDEDKVKSTFRFFGGLVGPFNVLETIKQIIEETPAEFKCLCDEDEIALQQGLLSKKEDITQDQIDELISKSKARKAKKINDLLDVLNKKNPLDGVMPPLFCKKNPDGTFEKGMIEGDPPTINHMVDSALNTIYDAIVMSFNTEIDRFIPQLLIETYKLRIIPRTIVVPKPGDRAGEGKREFNPEFLSYRMERNYAFGSLPAGSLKPGYSGNEEQEEHGESPGFRGWAFETGFGFLTENGPPGDAALEPPHSIGMWDAYQLSPRPEQEYQWEMHNIDQEAKVARGGNLHELSHEPIGGRWKRTGEPLDIDNIQPWEYTEQYGVSPIPIIKRDVAGKRFAPGLQEAYRFFCGVRVSDNLESLDTNKIFSIKTTENKYKTYGFNIPNKILEQSGVDIDKIPTELAQGTADQMPFAIDTQTMADVMASVKSALGSIGSSKVDLNYVIPFGLGRQAKVIYENDRYNLTVKMTPGGDDPRAGYPVTLYNQLSINPINATAKKLIDDDGYKIDQEPYPHIPQEKYFASFLEKVWTSGNRIWRDQEEIVNKPDYAKGYLLPDSGLGKQLKNVYYEKEAYDGVFKDLMCSIALQIAESPLLNPNGKVISALNLHPMREMGKEDCDPNLLGIDTIKKRIKDEYSLIRCIEASYLSVGVEMDNKQKPFLKANLGGASLTLIRVYVLEILLRTVFSFYYFKYDNAEGIDSTLIDYIVTYIKDDVTKKQFFEEFKAAAIDLYNRNHPDLEQTVDIDIVLKYFVRWQILAVSNTLSGIVGAAGKTDLDSILLEKWLPTYHIPTSEKDIRFDIKPKSFEDESEMIQVQPGEIKALNTDLSMATISRMRADPSQQRGMHGDLYVNPVGAIYRQYFPGDPENAKKVWSFESPSETENKPQYTRYMYDEALSPSKTGGARGIREYHLLAAAEDFDGRLVDKLALGDDFKSSGLSFKTSLGDERVGIPDSERKALALLTKLLSGMNASYSPKSAAKGYYQIFSDSNSEARLATLLPVLSTADATTRAMEERRSAESAVRTDIERTMSNINLRGHTDLFAPGSYLRAWSLESIGLVGYGQTDPSLKSGTNFSKWIKGRAKLADRVGAIKQKYYFGSSCIAEERMRNLQRWTTPHGHPQRWSENVGIFRGAYLGDDLGYVEDWEWWIDPCENFEPPDLVDAWGPPQVGFDDRPTKWAQTERWFWLAGVHVGPWRFESVWSWRGGEAKWTLAIHPKREDLLQKLYGIHYGDWGDLVKALSPDGLRGSAHKKLLNRTVDLMQTSKTPYISLLDFDLTSGLNILKWEKDQWQKHLQYFKGINNNWETERNDSGKGRPGQYIHPYSGYNIDFYQDLVNQYDKWISDWQEVINLFVKGNAERLAKRKDIEKKILKYPAARRTMIEPLTYNFENGNLVQELYIRIDDLDTTNMGERYANPTAVINNKQYASRNGSQLFEAGYGNGVVNIEAFQRFMDQQFGTGDFPSHTEPAVSLTSKKVGTSADEVITVGSDCGVLLKTTPGVPIIEKRDDVFRLRDFFKNLSIGVRISYVLPIDDFTSTDKEQDPSLEEIQSSRPNGKFISNNEKAYFVREEKAGGLLSRNIKLVPLVSVERSFDMETKISDCINQKFTHDVSGKDGKIETKNFGFFKNFYRNESYNLLETMRTTPEYKLLFKYLFPIDRMLSITNIYSSTFLASTKGIDTTFDMTKHRLKRLFFVIERAGNPYAKCGPSNKDIMDALLNGLPLEGMAAMMVLIIVKTALLIFKGFMEVADINIATSKKIIDMIHLANKMIAQAQIMANSAGAMASAIGNIFATCEGEVEDAKRRILDDANELRDWVMEIKSNRNKNPGWSQRKLLAEVGVNTGKQAATMRLEKWIDEEIEKEISSGSKSIDSDKIFDFLKNDRGEFRSKTLEKAKEFNPDADTLKEIAEQDCNPDDCAPGERPPAMPSDDMFDPIDANFIPEPKIWQLGLALLPFTLIPFSPTPFPISLPFGLIYWVMDEKPMPDWLNSTPPADWLDKLFAKETDEEIKGMLPSSPETCVPDLGLPPPGTFDDDN